MRAISNGGTKAVRSGKPLSDDELHQAINEVARLMFMDASLSRQIRYLKDVLDDSQDVREALAFVEREGLRMLSWTGR